ncbi:pre-rRNA-processing protein las1 isoform X2 [Humulus lupulus]|uniref:pre-rRNA-processing protein las1 isoform X2 n=1 Tax=Humulus lupulus TaxID=3486 RepID=UPI002B40B981|nr:pre-rRNA-processing protein las1 isoform X2 [Humulus lupulus]
MSKLDDGKDERTDLKNIMKDIELLGYSHMTWKEKKAFENRKVASLGGKRLILGRFCGSSSGNSGSGVKRSEVKRRPEDRVLKSSQGVFRKVSGELTQRVSIYIYKGLVMESILAFEEEQREFQQQEISSTLSSSSYGLKLVPWMSWEEWLFVYDSLFSDSLHAVSSALRKISTWGSRGCLPVTIEVTASIIEIQMRDPHFRKDQTIDASNKNRANQGFDDSLSDEMLAMLYCMAIMRLVNGVVEKTRKQCEVSIAVAADAINMPRTLIDIRHEGSHRELPALQIVRSASVKAVDWLKSYYWEPQKKAVPFQGDSTTKIRKRIKSKLRELAFCLKAKESPELSSSPLQGKRNKKQITNVVKNLVGLYSSCSSEVVSIVLDFLLKTLNSSHSMELLEDTQVGPSIDTFLHDWKLVITKFSNKQPELLVALLNAVLGMIEVQETKKDEIGGQLISSDNSAEIHQVEHLSSLFAWLASNLKELKHGHKAFKTSSADVKSTGDSSLSNAALMQLVHKCLVLSASGNKQLLDSAILIAQLIGDNHLMKKLNKISFLVLSNSEIIENDVSLFNSKDLIQPDESISQAREKLELIKHCRIKVKKAKTTDGDVEISRKWIVATSWNPCPIGMLPNSFGSSGCLPVLDYKDDENKFPEMSQARENLVSNHYNETIQPDIPLLDDFVDKKRRRAVEDDCVSDVEDVWSPQGFDDKLWIGGLWKKLVDVSLWEGHKYYSKVEELAAMKFRFKEMQL